MNMVFEVESVATCWNTEFKDAEAMKVPWPSGEWPKEAASTFEPELFIDEGFEGEYDSDYVERLADRWTKGKAKTQPPMRCYMRAAHLPGRRTQRLITRGLHARPGSHATSMRPVPSLPPASSPTPPPPPPACRQTVGCHAACTSRAPPTFVLPRSPVQASPVPPCPRPPSATRREPSPHALPLTQAAPRVHRAVRATSPRHGCRTPSVPYRRPGRPSVPAMPRPLNSSRTGSRAREVRIEWRGGPSRPLATPLA